MSGGRRDFIGPQSRLWAIGLGLCLLAVALTSLVQAQPQAQPPFPAQMQSAGRNTPYQLENLSYYEGMDRLGAMERQKADGPIVVRLLRDGKPVSGREIWFHVVDVPEGEASERWLSATTGRTNSEGQARTTLTAGAGPGLYVVEASLEGDWSQARPISIRVQARERLWIVTLMLGLFGGLALFLFGMDWSGNNLQKVAGDKFRTLMRVLTRNPWFGAVLGAFSTFLLQSSSASTVMLVGLVSATLLTLSQAIGVIIGAKIGTTFTVQIISFNISEYALAIVAIGLVIRMTASIERNRQLGKAIMGFGFIFFGMGLMTLALKPLRAMPEFNQLLIALGDWPVLAVIAATLFTVVIQSSSATIGVALALASQGMLTLEAGIYIGMGAAIGTCATALLASLGANRAGKQVAVAHLIYSILSTLLFFPFVTQLADVTRDLSLWMGDVDAARQIANGFTLFALSAGLIFLPFSRYLARLTEWLVPLKEEAQRDFGPKFLQSSSISYPAVAIEQALLETLHMGELLRRQMVGVSLLVEEPNLRRIYELTQSDDQIDILERAIRPFLTRVAQQELDNAAAARERALVYVADTMEGIGDIVVRSLLHALEKMAQRGLRFSDEGRIELLSSVAATVDRYDRVLVALKKTSHALAQDIIADHEQTEWRDRLSRAAHLERLHKGLSHSLESSEAHLSITGALLTINRRITDIAAIIRDEMPR
jgi:phosphate:Na+ symporter